MNADMSSSLPPSVCLFVPTFRRPDGLRRLLKHVAMLEYAGALTIVVVDNDAVERAGQAVVAEMSPAFHFPLRCVVERQRGQTFAYNRGFVEACRQLIRRSTWPCSMTTNSRARGGFTKWSRRRSPAKRTWSVDRCSRSSIGRIAGSPARISSTAPL